MKLALFDFDGTVTTHDSLRDFLFLSFGSIKFLGKILPVSPWILAYLLKIADNQRVKEMVSVQFFKGMCTKEFESLARPFALEHLPKIVRPKALEKLNWHKEQGHRIILVSASFTDYLKYWCEEQEIELISTQLEIKDGHYTGKFATANCWGPEKVKRIKAEVNLEDYQLIYAYGDSRGDKEMLELAQEKGFRVFS